MRGVCVVIICCAVFLGLLSACGRKVRDVRGSGTIEADEVQVAAETNGRTLRMIPEEGEAVKRGDLLAEIDHAVLDLQLAQAEAGVKLARAQLQNLLAGARPEDIKQAEEAVVQAKENLRIAREDFARIQELYGTGSATKKQLDDAGARAAVAESQHNSAIQMLKKVEHFARPQEIEEANARLEGAIAQAKIIEQRILASFIRAPIDGVVTKWVQEVGDYAVPGTVLFTLADLSTVHLTIYVGESDLGRIRLGQGARVSIDSSPERAFTGKVVFISPVAQFTPKNVQTREERVKLVYGVRIEIENPDGIFKQGMPADAVISAED